MINNCSFEQANIVLLPLKNSQKSLPCLTAGNPTRTRDILNTRSIGYIRMPPLIAHRLTFYRREGKATYNNYKIDFVVFSTEDYFSDIHTPDRVLVDHYQEDIISKCVAPAKPVVWVFGYPPLLKLLHKNFLEGGALVHYYVSRNPNDILFLLIEKPEPQAHIRYTTRIIDEKGLVCPN